MAQLSIATILLALLHTTETLGYCVRNTYDFDSASDYRQVEKASDNQACQTECDTEDRCTAVTWIEDSDKCVLKDIRDRVKLIDFTGKRTMNIKGACDPDEAAEVPDYFAIEQYDQTLSLGDSCKAESICGPSNVCADGSCKEQELRRIGSDCDNFLKGCEDGSSCDSAVCRAVVFADAGAPCATSVPCVTGLTCTSNVCTLPKSILNDPCSVTQPCADLLICSDAVCVEQEVVGIGEVCQIGGVTLLCADNGVCKNSFCIAPPKPVGAEPNEECLDTKPCSTGLACEGGICRAALTCEATPCPAGLMCANSRCVSDPERLACAGKCQSGSVCTIAGCEVDENLPGGVAPGLESCETSACDGGYKCSARSVCVPDLNAGSCDGACDSGKVCGAAGECVGDPGGPESDKGTDATCDTDCPAGTSCEDGTCTNARLPDEVVMAECLFTACPSRMKCEAGACTEDENYDNCSVEACVAGEMCPDRGVVCVRDAGVPKFVYNDADIAHEQQSAEAAINFLPQLPEREPATRVSDAGSASSLFVQSIVVPVVVLVLSSA